MVTLLAPLSGLKTHYAAVILDDNTEIHPWSQVLDKPHKQATEEHFLRHPSEYRHCLVIKNAQLEREDRSDAKELIEEVVLRLRLYAPGDVGWTYGIVDHGGWYYTFLDEAHAGKRSFTVNWDLQLFAVFFYVVWYRDALAKEYVLTEADSAGLKALFSACKGRKLMREAAFRFFFRAYHDPYASDRFLRNALALESLLLAEDADNSNLAYKFADRGTFLLHQAMPDLGDPEGYFKSLQDIYKGRSGIVHRGEWGMDDIPVLLQSNADKFARCLLNYIVFHPEFAKAQNIDRAKRQRYASGWRPT